VGRSGIVGKKDKEDQLWASSGDHLVADPATLRGYGQNIAKLRFDFQTDVTTAGMGLRGTGRDTAISTGMYEPGMTCNDLLDSNGQEMTTALGDFLTCMTSIPAGIFTMADLYGGQVAHGKAMINAQYDAMLWAFATPGADRPAGAPSYIKGTIKGEMEKYAAENPTATGADKFLSGGHYSGADVEVYQTAGGGMRYVVRTAGGGYTEWAEDADGNRLYQTVQQGNGPVVTTNYTDGKESSVIKRYKATSAPLPNVFTDKDTVSVVDEQQVVETIKDGKVTTTTDHVVVTKYSDGTESHDYYTDKNGERTKESSVGRQPPATTPDTWSDLAKKQGQAMETKARGL
jgi:hypothetical protein